MLKYFLISHYIGAKPSLIAFSSTNLVYNRAIFKYDKTMKKDEPLVSAAELEALIHGWGANTQAKSVDKFFALRYWFVCFVAGSYAIALLFFPGKVAQNLSVHEIEIARITNFLYFRGWFLVIALSFVTFCYVKNWYFGIVLCATALLASVNLIFDLFNVYAEQLSNPSPRLTFLLLVRLVCLSFVFISIKNLSRMPVGEGRLSIFLPFKKYA